MSTTEKRIATSARSISKELTTLANELDPPAPKPAPPPAPPSPTPAPPAPTPSPTPSPTPPPAPAPTTTMDFAVAVYNSSQQPTEAPDLAELGVKFWCGGEQITPDYLNEREMLKSNFNFMPGFPMGTNYKGAAQAVLDVTAVVSEISGTEDGVPLTQQRYYSTGNEVNLPASDYTNPATEAPVQFHTYLDAILQKDPGAKIVAPNVSSMSGFTAPQFGYGTGEQWLRAFVAAYQAQYGGIPPIDVLGMHVYNYDTTGNVTAVDPAAYAAEVQKLRSVADSLGYEGKPIWITEMGFMFPSVTPFELTDAQLAVVKDTLTGLQAIAEATLLERVFLFSSDGQADGLRAIWEPSVLAGPLTAVPLTEYGKLVASLAA